MTKFCSRWIILTRGLKILPFSDLGSRVRQLSWVPKPRPIPEDPPPPPPGRGRQLISGYVPVCRVCRGISASTPPPSPIFSEVFEKNFLPEISGK
eukprot:4994850-Pleurochrysis_carterae.AAC.1